MPLPLTGRFYSSAHGSVLWQPRIVAESDGVNWQFPGTTANANIVLRSSLTPAPSGARFRPTARTRTLAVLRESETSLAVLPTEPSHSLPCLDAPIFGRAPVAQRSAWAEVARRVLRLAQSCATFSPNSLRQASSLRHIPDRFPMKVKQCDNFFAPRRLKAKP